MTTPNRIIIARTFIGRPFQHQGRGHGLDCAGLIKTVGDLDGKSFEDVYAYRAQPSQDELRKAVRRNLGDPTWVATVKPTPVVVHVGDVVMVKFAKALSHLAFIGDYVHGGFSLIHAFEAGINGRVVEHRLDSKWASKVAEVYSWPV